MRPEDQRQCYFLTEIDAGRDVSSRDATDGWERPFPAGAGS
jgi:hypothetical protein